MMGEPPEIVVEEPAYYPAKTLTTELLDPTALPLEHRGADLAATLAKVEQLIAENFDRSSRFGAAEVYFFTDLARNTWDAAALDARKTSKNSGARAGFQKRLEQLRAATDDHLYVIDVGQDGSENAAVTDVRVVAPYATVGRPARIEAKVKNFGSRARQALKAEVLIDGQRVKEFSVDVMAGQETALPAFEHTFDAPGDHLVEVRASEDKLAIDNRRAEAIRVEPALRVLCVNGKPDSDPLADGVEHLALALSALDQPDKSPRIQTRTILETELLSTSVDLDEYHAVIVSNVAAINREEARLLSEYLKRGGAAIFFLGDQVRAEAYNRVLHDAVAKAKPILPLTVDQVVRGKLRGFELGDYKNPIADYFRGQRGPGLSRQLVCNYHRLVLDKNSGARVLLDFAGGDPAIIAADVGRGRAIVVATTAAVDPAGESVWSAMPYEKLYVPFVHKILETAVAGQLSHNTVRVGDPLAVSLKTGAPTINFVLELDERAGEPPQKLAEGQYNLDQNAGRWLYGDTDTAGVYRLQIKTPLESRSQFAANVDTAESDLARIDRDELPEGFALVELSETPDANLASAAQPPYDPAHAALLYAVLCLLLAESLLAWRFSHRSL
jgi:hypothetical protein